MIFNCQFIVSLLFVLLLSSATPLALKTGTIYKIHCQVTGKIYIGRTTIGVEQAMRKNKNKFECYRRGTDYSHDTVFEVLVNNNYNVTILHEIQNLTNDTELRKQQRYYIEQYVESVNKYIPCRTRKEYNADNHDHLLQSYRNYRRDHRDTILPKMRAYMLRNKPRLTQKVICEICGVECTKRSLWGHKKSQRHLAALAKLNNTTIV